MIFDFARSPHDPTILSLVLGSWIVSCFGGDLIWNQYVLYSCDLIANSCHGRRHGFFTPSHKDIGFGFWLRLSLFIFTTRNDNEPPGCNSLRIAMGARRLLRTFARAWEFGA